VDNHLVDHQFENEIVTKSGELRLIQWHNTVLTENGEFRMILSLGEDITEQKELAAQFQQAQKMESVGRAGKILKLYFPRDRTGIVEKTVADIQHPDAGRGETILVVDDDELIRRLLGQIL
jgi:hypothetical protein